MIDLSSRPRSVSWSKVEEQRWGVRQACAETGRQERALLGVLVQLAVFTAAPPCSTSCVCPGCPGRGGFLLTPLQRILVLCKTRIRALQSKGSFWVLHSYGVEDISCYLFSENIKRNKNVGDRKKTCTGCFMLLCGGIHEYRRWVILIAANFNMQFRIP